MTTRILTGDVRAVLATLPPESVHCVVTSPPYFGLRDYKIEPRVWGGDPECEHSWEVESVAPQTGGTGPASAMQVTNRGTQGGVQTKIERAFCLRCSAWRGSLGLEPTLDLYLPHLVDVCRAIRRVLRKDGTFWLNIGDSYAGSWGAQGRRMTQSDEPSWHSSQIKNHPKRASYTGSMRAAGLKPKDMMMVPHRLALALQADGWWVRDEIVWAKLNPMPESVTDRCTRAHEFVFMLTKSARYFYDAEAIKEVADDKWFGERRDDGGGDRFIDLGIRRGRAGSITGKRNKRSVWTLASEPFPDAHFATFPTRLVKPCILAGTSAKGVCPQCGAPWARVIERESRPNIGLGVHPESGGRLHRNPGGGVGKDARRVYETGWRAACRCDAVVPIPATVLDPFGGSGTTGLVADRLGRDCILIDLNPGYADMARNRIADDAGLFAEVAAE